MCYLIIGMLTGLFFISNKYFLIIYTLLWPVLFISYIYIYLIKVVFIDNLE